MVEVAVAAVVVITMVLVMVKSSVLYSRYLVVTGYIALLKECEIIKDEDDEY